jgi:hypothetical protein
VAANFLGIDTLTLQSVGGSFATGPVYLLVDNFSYSLDEAGATAPEPATLLLFGSGALGLMARRARRGRRPTH